MSLHHRRRDNKPTTKAAPKTPTPAAKLTINKFIITIIPTIAIVTIITTRYTTSHPTPTYLPFSTPPDDEATISNHHLPYEEHTPPNFREEAPVCMPTVTRQNTEYVSNAIKSFRLATRNSTSLRRLIVYNMDNPPTAPIWLSSVFPDGGVHATPSWLQLRYRQGDVAPPRKATLSDSWERVVWRSKEALDYAQLLERCAGDTHADWLIVVQDDVLFTSSITSTVAWAERNMVDRGRLVNGRRVGRVCAVSLFDIADGGVDGEELRSSNMVARVWRRADVPNWVNYFRQRFDEAPIDWLADQRCRGRRGWVTVMWPNPVRHRGRVSSFFNNTREGLLT